MGRDGNKEAKPLPKGITEYAKSGGAFLAIVLSVLGAIQVVDWRIKSIVESEEYIGKIATHVRPYVIFDQNASVFLDGGGMQYLLGTEYQPIEVEISEKGSSGFDKLHITVRPRLELAVAPLIEVLSTHEGIVSSKHGKGYEWVYDFELSGYVGNDNQVRFRLEILK